MGLFIAIGYYGSKLLTGGKCGWSVTAEDLSDTEEDGPVEGQVPDSDPEEIAGQTGADLFEITCVEPYSDSRCGYRRRACGQLFRGCIHAFGCQCMAGNKSCG